MRSIYFDPFGSNAEYLSRKIVPKLKTNGDFIQLQKKPQLIGISQGRIIRVHLPLLYPHLPHYYQDEIR